MIFNETILKDQKYIDLMKENPETYSTENIDIELKYENMNMNESLRILLPGQPD